MRKIVQFFCALGLVFGLGATLTAQAAEPVSDLQASEITSSSASISWNGSGDRFELRYGLPGEVIFSLGLDDADYEDLSGFSTLDSDGDGNNWGIYSGLTGYIHSGDLGFYSASYASGALTPDNWLILPELELGGSISFWANGVGSWAEEHFGVGVFFEGDEELTMLDEWTATAEPTQYVVDLSAYAGRTGYIVIRHFDCTDMYLFLVDDIEVIGAPQWIQTADPAENPFEISGLDPFTEYVVDVRSWAGEEASEWARISFQTKASGPDQEAADYVIGLIDAIGEVDFPSSFDAIGDAYDAYFALTETQQALVTNRDVLFAAIARWNALFEEGLAINDLAANHITATSANISWSSPKGERFDLVYGPKGELLLSEDFESGMEGWTTIDNDGDGYNWVWKTDDADDINLKAHNDSEGSVGSASYINYVGATEPDNWLVSPQVELGGTFSFWAAGQDPDYPSEIFGVYVSATGTDVADFVQVGDDFVATGDWEQIVVDLSDFSGKGYVAIRHYNVTDMFKLLIDDVEIRAAAEKVIIRDITSTSYELTGLNPETEYTVEVRGKLGEDFEGYWYSIDFTTKGTEPSFDIDNLRADEITANSALISWESDASNFDLRYRELVPGAVVLFEDFESGEIGSDWTINDSDGDGFNWGITTGDQIVVHSGTSCVASASYDNPTYTALTPDNWLTTPQVELGGSLSFWAAGQDASYASEVFGVYVSTDGVNWDLLGSDITATSTMTQYTFDLSAYSGKGYIAFRHYNCTDMFRLNIDDIEITGPAVEGSWIDVPALSDKSHLLDGLNPETAYEVQVSAAGADNWASVIFTTMPAVAPLEVINVEAIDITDNSATIQWYSEAQNFELRYREKAVGDVIFSDDFESGMGSWTTIDNDGDGYNWFWQIDESDNVPVTLKTHNDSEGSIGSASYINGLGALAPDNWLISPQVELGGSISFWAIGQDPSYAAEVFAVLVSTDDGESWTQLGSNFTATGDWKQIVVDLSAYSGQGLVAIRHYNCTDMFKLVIDDVEIIGPAPETPWTVMSGISGLSQYLGLLNSNTTYDVEVRAVNGEEVGEWVATQFTTEMSEEDIQALVQPVIDLINAIGEVEYTLESYNAIGEADDAYSALPEDVQPYVTNYDVLEAAIDRFNELDDAAVDDVVAFMTLVNAIDDPVTLESEDGIVAAREAYDALPELAIIFYGQAMANYVEALEAAEEALAQLKLQAAKDELQAVIDDLKAIQALAEEYSAPATITVLIGTLISNAEAVLNNEEATLEQVVAATNTAKAGLNALIAQVMPLAKEKFIELLESLKQPGDNPDWWEEILVPAEAQVGELAWDFSQTAAANIASLKAQGQDIYDDAKAALDAKRSAQGIEETLDGVQVKKVVIDNHVFILRGEKMFNMNGAEVK